MTWDLDPAPFTHEHPFLVDDEGAALDAADFLPVHQLLLHDTELPADRLIRIRKQIEREPHLFLEALVGGERVARNAEHPGAGAPELRMEVAEVGALGGAAGRVVLGIEVQDHLGSAQSGELEGRATGTSETEVGDRLTQHFPWS